MQLVVYRAVQLQTGQGTHMLTCVHRKPAYNGHASTRTGPRSNGRCPGLRNAYLMWMAGCVPGEEKAPGSSMGRRQAGGGNVRLSSGVHA